MESDQDNLIRSDDAVLLEAGEILADLIQLNRNKRLQANLNTGKEPSLFDYIGEMLE